jgi:hypothetical protein
MARKQGIWALAVILGLGLSGCSAKFEKQRIGQFTVVSTRNVELHNLDQAHRKIKARGVEGLYLTESEVLDQNAVTYAVEDAVNKAAGDLMINCVIYQVKKGKERGYMVQGDVIQTLKESYE